LPARISLVGEEKEPVSLDAVTSDISAGGAYFRTDKPLSVGVGTQMDVDLVLPLDELKKLEGKRARIKVKGAVVRITENGIAICFNKEYQISPLAE
jgi:c-di-GMP-binding flagellar brake protein YcgR